VDPVLHVPYSSLSKITNKIILIVRTDCRQSLTLTGIAERMHMSSKYIGRIFLKDTGIKFSEYLMAYRMLEARRLIINTQEKISVIAGMVGYAQLNNFYIHFRSYFGVSPSALRNFETVGELAEV
jgi:AraC-like DNA-binding protein